MSAASLWLVAAILAQGLLVFVITTLLYRARLPLIIRGKVKMADIALDKERWPEPSRLVANSYTNQFEMPVLFFVAALVALWFGATLLDAILAWAFIVSRYIHAAIHVTTNYVTHRFFAFATGTVIVAIWWIALVIRLILTATAGGTA